MLRERMEIREREGSINAATINENHPIRSLRSPTPMKTSAMKARKKNSADMKTCIVNSSAVKTESSEKNSIDDERRNAPALGSPAGYLIQRKIANIKPKIPEMARPALKIRYDEG